MSGARVLNGASDWYELDTGVHSARHVIDGRAAFERALDAGGIAPLSAVDAVRPLRMVEIHATDHSRLPHSAESEIGFRNGQDADDVGPAVVRRWFQSAAFLLAQAAPNVDLETLAPLAAPIQRRNRVRNPVALAVHANPTPGTLIQPRHVILLEQS